VTYPEHIQVQSIGIFIAKLSKGQQILRAGPGDKSEGIIIAKLFEGASEFHFAGRPVLAATVLALLLT
jgi:hypothetical protein